MLEQRYTNVTIMILFYLFALLNGQLILFNQLLFMGMTATYLDI